MRGNPPRYVCALLASVAALEVAAQPAESLDAAVRVLASAPEHGLDAADYDVDGLAARVAAASGLEDRSRVGEEVQGAVRHFLDDLRGGRVEVAARGLIAEVAPPPMDLDALARAVVSGEDLRKVAASVEPRHPAYARLAAALPRWRARAAAPEPSLVPPVPKVKGAAALDLDGWEGAPALRARLAWLGDLDPSAPPPVPPLVEVLRRFQARHGIPADAVLGPRTLAALNVPASRRVRQIELSMERLRWFPAPGPRLVYAEVPRAVLWALDAGEREPALTMRLVVGAAPDHETPMLASRITAVVFRPYWVPTKAIIREEILPAVRSRPGWLDAHGMEIVASGEEDAESLEPDDANLEAVAEGRLTIRQRPGPRNDLGPVKFVVPNPSCIGLHGTPHQQLFERPRRDRSHGCVRLENPLALSEWVLRGQDGWNRERVEAAVGRSRPTTVRLQVPVDVAVAYVTASVDPDGTEYFLEDIYGLDGELERLLAARRPGAKGSGPTRRHVHRSP